MTKRSLAIRFRIVMTFYVVVVLAAVAARIYDPSANALVYNTVGDVLPLIITIPAVWLGHCLQRRTSYLQQLRSIWSHLIHAVHSAKHFMELDKPQQRDFANTLTALSVAIDEIRGVFMNLKETPNDIGLYPFEPIKEIHKLVEQSCHSPMSLEQRKIAKERIFELWRAARKELLREFDREEPTFYHSHYAHPERERIVGWPPQK